MEQDCSRSVQTIFKLNQWNKTEVGQFKQLLSQTNGARL